MAKEIVLLVAGGNAEGLKDLLQPYDEYRNARFVGIDGGCLELIKHGYPIDLAVGDFDSISMMDRRNLKLVAKEIIELHPKKDDTDTQMALKVAMEKYPEASSFRFFATGGARLDHFFSNFFLGTEPRFFSIVDKIHFYDANNEVRFFQAGEHKLVKNEGMNYLGFFAITPVEEFEILDALYTLPKTNLSHPYVYPSNEFVENVVHFSLSSGIVAAIQSKD